MTAIALLGLALGLCGLGCSPAFSQAKPVQQAGNCSINTNGSNNTTSLVCTEIDPKLAEQVQALINGTQHNEKAIKDISTKLDLILRQVANIPAKAQPRGIPPEKRLALDAFIGSLPDTSGYLVFEDVQDAETLRYADALYRIFDSHHKAARLGHGLSWPIIPEGVHVLVHSRDDVHYGVAQQLVAGLLNCGVEIAEFATADFVPVGEIRIVIGIDPQK